MGDVARCSVKNEDLLYKLFGKNAELLIDHAWGWEPCTVEAIKAYKPSTNSLGSGQVLHCPYEAEKAKLKLNMVDGGDLRAYVNLIVDGMDREQLAAMEKAPLGFAAKIRVKIESLLEQHYKETFFTWLDRGKIVCEPSYRLPAAIHPTSSTAIYGRSLYEAEEDMNALEQDLVKRLTAIPNVLWWHRNIARHGFAINGYFNHYPDIMIMTQSGKIILAETKGEHLKNDDSQEKIELGAACRNAAGNRYRYYMVFRDEENLPHGAVSMGQFVETVEAL